MATLRDKRREGAAEAALPLQNAGLVRQACGRITALDRPRLEARSCECCAVVNKACDRPPPVTRRLQPRRRRTSRSAAAPSASSTALAGSGTGVIVTRQARNMVSLSSAPL